MIRNVAWVLFALLVLIGTLESVRADGVWSVGRATNDRDQDLVEALVQRERYDDALSLCRMFRRGADPEADVSAKWAILQSQILVARQMGQNQFEETDVQATSKPVSDLASSYPEHRRKWFLRAQASIVQRSAALHRVLRAAVSPADDNARVEATTSLLRANVELETLVKEIGDARILLDQQTENRPFAMMEDMARLQQELQVESVSLALMQTELCAPGSDDCIAAATRAEQIADQAIAKLPSDTKARKEVERLKVESMLQAGQYDRADRELKLMITAKEPLSSPRWTALQIRLDMAQQRMDQASARLNRYYGDQPGLAPRSIEMDLAKFEFMLRNDPAAASGDWLDAIQSRGGVYARRRAEAMAISLLGRSNSSMTPAIDPSLVAAQGEDYLRRGEPGRAAELLAAAAVAETNPDRAVQRAAQAAAAFGLVDRQREAASVLAQTAVANPEAKQAAAAHLQAAVLVASHDPQAAESLEAMLRVNLKQWPAAETSTSARAWLQKLLIGQQRFVEAAETVTDVPAAQVSAELIDSIASQWHLAQRNGSEVSSEISQRFYAAYQPLLSNPIAAERFPLLVALLIDRGLLGQVRLANDMVARDPFAGALLAYRERGTESDPLLSPPQDVIADATERLMRDGRENPVLRKSIARLLGQWQGNDDQSIEHAERLLWGGQIEQSVKIIHNLMRDQPGVAEVTVRAAKLLESSNDAEAMKEAIRLWDQLAAGAPQGTPLWHEAKLAGIAALRRSGNADEAQRRARYVLLTLPTMDDVYRQQYQSLAN